MDGNICKICNKNYASYKSLWNHNKKFHKVITDNSNSKVSLNVLNSKSKVSLK